MNPEFIRLAVTITLNLFIPSSHPELHNHNAGFIVYKMINCIHTDLCVLTAREIIACVRAVCVWCVCVRVCMRAWCVYVCAWCVVCGVVCVCVCFRICCDGEDETWNPPEENKEQRHKDS